MSRPGSADPPMSDVHRLLLQGIMSRAVCSKQELTELCASCCENFNVNPPADDKGFQKFINTINDNIRNIHMEIRKGISEEDGEMFYVLVNTCENNIARMASVYSVAELELFKKIVEKVVTDSDNGSVSSTAILNLTDQLEKRITKKATEELLDKWANEGWLVKHKRRGLISLGVRSTLELDHYIRQMYPDDMVLCAMCKTLVLKGQECSSDNCEVKLHDHCAKRRFKDVANKECPKCKQQWEG